MGLVQNGAQWENEAQAGNDHWLWSRQPGHHSIAKQDKQNMSLSTAQVMSVQLNKPWAEADIWLIDLFSYNAPSELPSELQNQIERNWGNEEL